MNARQPLYVGPTANPCADATRWNDEQELADELAQEAARQGPLIALAKLNNISRPGDWFKDHLYAGRGFAADEVLHDAVASDDDTMDAYAELLTGPHAQKLRQCMAAWFGRVHAQAIYQDHLEERNES